MNLFRENGHSVNKIAEISMKPGVAPVLMVLGSLLRGTGYILSAFSDDLADAGKRKPFDIVSAMRDRWLYKYAIRVITDRQEIKNKIERESAGLDVSVVLVTHGSDSR